jgi:hypothetical protein
MDTDIFSSRIAATGTVVTGRFRMKAISIAPNGVGAVSITLRDGGAGGTVRCVIDSNSTTVPYYLEMPAGGILFTTDIHATITNTSAITVFYG